jgi:KaiC/GvpD/RAD55 family RecA-like ATPase
MTIEFQEALLKFLFHQKDAKKYRKYLESDIFDNPDAKFIYSLWDNYIDRYGSVPSKPYFLEFFSKVCKKNKSFAITADTERALLRSINDIYDTFENDVVFIEEEILLFAQKKLTKNFIRDYAEKVNDDDEDMFAAMQKEITAIANLRKEFEKGGPPEIKFMFKNLGQNNFHHAPASPTFLKALNKMTSARGFYTPQNIVFLGGPKSFKTGLLLNLAIEFARDGLKVYYSDTENGERSITQRIEQGVIKCEVHELGDRKDHLVIMQDRMRAMGGEIVMGRHFDSTLDDVDADLERIFNETGWKPDVIVHDYLDKYRCSDKSIREEHRQLDQIFKHAVTLNEKWGTFSVGVSVIKQDAFQDEIIDVGDFGRSASKAYNCHAAFGICRNEWELQNGYARIIPAVQREGTPYKGNAETTCSIQLDENIMKIEEVDSVWYLSYMLEKCPPTERKKKGYTKVDFSSKPTGTYKNFKELEDS